MKRYNPNLIKVNWNNDYDVEMVESDNGDYVKHEEIKDLQEQLEQSKDVKYIFHLENELVKSKARNEILESRNQENSSRLSKLERVVEVAKKHIDDDDKLSKYDLEQELDELNQRAGE